MSHYCEYPIWKNGWPRVEECGQPACCKVYGTWLCVLHEDAGYAALAAAAEEEALDSLIEAVPEEDCACCNEAVPED